MIKKIPFSDLKPGMFVVDTGLSWMDHPYLFSDEGEFSAEQISTIKDKGYLDTFVDTTKGSYQWEISTDISDEKQVRDGVINADKVKRRHQVPLVEEVGVAKTLYDDSLQLARDFMTTVQQDGEVDYEKSEDFVEEIIGSVTRNPDALVSLTKLRSFDEYTFTHSINVAVMATAFGSYLGLNDDDLHGLGIAALFHDLGKALVPECILNKPGKLTDQEFEVMKKHPLRSFRVLEKRGEIPKGILRGIVEHHEKYNGQGYPRGLCGDDIHPYARIIAVADVYDALSSRRVYKPPMMPNKALTIIYGMRAQDFYPGHAERFIKFMGIYPVGSLVRLASGEHAIVTGSNSDAPLRPLVNVCLNTDMTPIKQRLVDLAEHPSDDKAYNIVETLDHEPYGINPADYLA